MIVVEGPDLVGKTTLCERLLRELPGPRTLHRFGLLPEGWDYLEHYRRIMFAAAEPGTTVFDRFYLSELVYGGVLRNAIGFNRSVFDVLEVYARACGAFTVVVVADSDAVETRTSSWLAQQYVKRGDAVYRLDQIQAVNREFHYVAACMPAVMIDGEIVNPRVDYVHNVPSMGWPSENEELVGLVKRHEEKRRCSMTTSSR